MHFSIHRDRERSPKRINTQVGSRQRIKILGLIEPPDQRPEHQAEKSESASAVGKVDG